MKRLILLAVVLSVGVSLAGWRGRFDEQFAQLFGGATGPLPAGWTECEYLESTGTQYINTGFAPTLYTTDIEVDCMSLAANNRMWGVTESIGGVYSRIAEYVTWQGTIQMFPTTTGNSSWGLGHSISNRAVIAVSANKVYVDGVLKFTHVGPGTVFTKPMFVLGENNAGSPALGKSRLYGCRIWSSGVLVRDYLPALDGDGVPCLYDAVTQAAFYNAVAGDFLYQIKEQ